VTAALAAKSEIRPRALNKHLIAATAGVWLFHFKDISGLYVHVCTAFNITFILLVYHKITEFAI